ncbi:hypothetical protein BIU82_02015 [Arthrobacter sp. SW1]|uniref:DUF4129 domain-containing protein n=1 Tax=Arthrobacter sp. SW1 TaxID=1920889 RepID=UPI000877C45B|nr:DUF4129 domain-containing protein [Arthrobacter sp. SW1]OFI39845.1 hypothetical protein BIU82_02015 [Arthrobacter sp. SW1]
MTALSAMAAVLAADVPVDPDRNEARRWAIEELAKPQYAAAQPNWLEQLLDDFLEWLGSLNGDIPGPAPDWTWPLLVSLAVVLLIVAVIVVRPRLNAARKQASAAVFDAESNVDAGTFRKRAAAAAARGDWSTAVVEQFRAIVRSAEDRTVLDPQAGRTADEAAAQLARAFSGSQDRLETAAALFDAVKYGRAASGPEQYESLKSLDAELSTLKPDYLGDPGHRLAVPK